MMNYLKILKEDTLENERTLSAHIRYILRKYFEEMKDVK